MEHKKRNLENLKLVSYTRVSTGHQTVKDYGRTSQKRSIEYFTKSYNGEIIHSFKEQDSGRVGKQLILQEAINLCVTFGYTLIVDRVDRLTRNLLFCIQALKIEKLNIVIASKPEMTKSEMMWEALRAQDEAEKKSINTKRGLEIAKLEGKSLGNPQNFSHQGRLEGAKTVKLQSLQDEKNREAGALIMEMVENDKSYSAIANKLNRLGKTTRRGAQFTKQSVYRLYKKYESNPSSLYVA